MRCSECKMGFNEENPDDEELHRVHHDKVIKGVRVLVDHATIAWLRNEDRIVVVTPQSSDEERAMTEEVAQVAKFDMPSYQAAFHVCENWDKRQVHLFLFERGDRVVGYARFERVTHARNYTWKQYDNRTRERLPEHAAMWSVGNLWVNRNYRHKGIAKQLVTESARNLGANLQTIGWQDPFSDDAIRFLRRIYPDEFILGK